MKVLAFERYCVFTQVTTEPGKETTTSVLNLPWPKNTVIRKLKKHLPYDTRFFYQLSKKGEAKHFMGDAVATFTLTEHDGPCPPNHSPSLEVK